MVLHAFLLPGGAEEPALAPAASPADVAALQLQSAQRDLQRVRSEMTRAEAEYLALATRRLCECVKSYDGPADVASMRAAVERELDAVHALRDEVVRGLAAELAAIEDRIALLEQQLHGAPGPHPHLTLQ